MAHLDIAQVLLQYPIKQTSYESKILRFHKELRREGLDIPLILPVHNLASDSVVGLLLNLLQNGCLDASATCYDGISLLYWICKNYDDEELIQVICLLVLNGADVNFYHNGHNPLMHLIKRSRHWTRVGDRALILETVLRFFISHGLDVNQTDGSGSNILSMLIKEQVFTVKKLAELTELLVSETGFDINGNGNNAYLDLLSATLPGISEEDSETIRGLTYDLLLYDLDVNAVDDRGYNALMLLPLDQECHEPTQRTAFALLNNGLDVNYKNHEERNALDIACCNDSYPAKSLLCFTSILTYYGVDIHNVDSFGQSSLMSLIDRPDATSVEVWKTIELLLDPGVSLQEEEIV